MFLLRVRKAFYTVVKQCVALQEECKGRNGRGRVKVRGGGLQRYEWTSIEKKSWER